MSVAVSLGKWIDPCNALRLNLNTTTFMQNDATRMRAIGARLDYMLNLHNAFGGLKPERRFWVNAWRESASTTRATGTPSRATV